MFSLNKRFVAILLIFAMTISNAGMSTLAVSISHYIDSANQNAKDDSDITYRYYEEYRYSYESRTTLLMNNDIEDELKEDVEENETEYAEELEEDESEMSESEESEDETSESETSESETSESETDESIESEESTTVVEEPTEQSEEESTHSSEIDEPDIASASDIEVNEETLETMKEDEIEIVTSLIPIAASSSDTKLFGTTGGTHTHKVCGLSAQPCTHIDMASHTENIEWEEFPTSIAASQVNDYLNGTTGSLGQYIFLSDDLTLTDNAISVRRDIYICLNGHSIIGRIAASIYKVVITNCKNSVGTIGNVDSTIFMGTNAEVYGLEFGGVKNINIKGSGYIAVSTSSAKNIYIYNAKFVKYESTSGNSSSAIRIGNYTGKKTVTFEKVEFEGSSNTNYKNSRLVDIDGDDDNSILNLRDITINNYNSVDDYFIQVAGGKVTFNGENTISNSKNIGTGEVIYLVMGILNVASGKTTIKGNTISGDNLVYLNDTFTVEKGATLNYRG